MYRIKPSLFSPSEVFRTKPALFPLSEVLRTENKTVRTRRQVTLNTKRLVGKKNYIRTVLFILIYSMPTLSYRKGVHLSPRIWKLLSVSTWVCTKRSRRMCLVSGWVVFQFWVKGKQQQKIIWPNLLKLCSYFSFSYMPYSPSRCAQPFHERVKRITCKA